MSLESVRIGVLNIQLPLPSTSIMGTMATITPTACSVDWVTSGTLANDLNPPLLTTDSYQFVVALGGADNVNGGYTCGIASTVTATVSPSDATSGIRLYIPNGSLPANYEQAPFMAVFVKVNSLSTYQLCKLAYIPTDGSDFETMIVHKPLSSAPKFALSVLQAATVDPILGSRSPYGFNYETVQPTTNAITENYNVTTVNVSPNNGPDFVVRTSIAAGLEFDLLLNDIKSIVRAAGGFATQYTATNGNTIIEGELGLATAQAILSGNQPVIVNYPPNANGYAETGVFLGLRTQNNQNLRLAWAKSATTPVNIVYDAVILDGMLISQHTKISFLRKAS